MFWINAKLLEAMFPIVKTSFKMETLTVRLAVAGEPVTVAFTEIDVSGSGVVGIPTMVPFDNESPVPASPGADNTTGSFEPASAAKVIGYG
jgi:hypothetical protein